MHSSDERIRMCLRQYDVAERSSAWTYLYMHADYFRKSVFQEWRDAFTAAPVDHEWGTAANVLTVCEDKSEDDDVLVNYLNTRWCVDSGANRDICQDVSFAEGKEIPKALTIGEAGRGHSFQSEAIGAVSLCTRTSFRSERLSLRV